MKKIKKTIHWLFGGISLAYILITIFPHFLFANKLEYKNFTVYYHSSYEVNIGKLKLILDKSEQLIKSSDLYDTEIDQNLFLCNNFNEFTFFALLSRKALAVNYPITQNIFVSKSSISENTVFRNGTNNNTRTLSGVIAHETTHSLLENHLGTIKYKLLPNWKNEGYCEFIANESSYDEQEGIIKICNEKEDKGNPSFNYFKYRLFTTHLFKERNISIEKFLNDDVDLETLNGALKDKYCTQHGINTIPINR